MEIFAKLLLSMVPTMCVKPDSTARTNRAKLLAQLAQCAQKDLLSTFSARRDYTKETLTRLAATNAQLDISALLLLTQVPRPEMLSQCFATKVITAKLDLTSKVNALWEHTASSRE
jgi:hypothetical protein